MQLRVPGPTPCPDDVLHSMTRQMVDHRGAEFMDLARRVTRKLQGVFQTQGDVLTLTTSGTGGLEAAVVNTLSPGDKVLSVSCGVFGDRFANIAEKYGAGVIRLQCEWGQAVDSDQVRKMLQSDADIKAVMLTHNETSTGVTNDLATICHVVKEFDKLLLVDAVSSLGAIDLPTDEWSCDVVVSASQKGWMAPPGLAMVSVNQKAWEAVSSATMPRFYFDLSKAKAFLDKGQTPWTPAVPLFYALDVALDVMSAEGLPNIFARHSQIANMTRDRIKNLGLSLFANEEYASNVVTAVKKPDGVDVKELRKLLQEEHGIVLAGGQQKLSGHIFRIAHLGQVAQADMEQVINALALALPKMGFSSNKTT
ncbi:MAG: alanine--glyoxylate aminotransferase family protein [Chloroflexota bacterium]|nr:alanine--glyoxylate aminotransferase family protein [Chloroflexota bacterium]